MENDNTKSIFQSNLGIALITFCTTIISSYFVFTSENFSTKVELYKAQNERIETLEISVLKLTEENIDLKIQIGGFKYMQGKEINYISIISDHIESMPMIAWCKKYYSPTDIRMVVINNEYEKIFGISNERYRGQSDFDNHPEEFAKRYRTNDLKVYDLKRGIHFKESVSIQHRNGASTVTIYHIWKYYLRLPSGDELICGQGFEYKP